MTTITSINPESRERKSPVPQIGSMGGRLYTRIVDPSDYPAIQKVVYAWSDLSQYKANDESDKEVKQRLSGCSVICESIKFALFKPTRLIDKIILICACRSSETEEEQIQGISISDMMFGNLSVNYLVTHPNNIGPSGIRGVGTALLQSNEAIAKKMKAKQIHLNSIESAIGFYVKLGYSKKKKELTDLNETPFMYKDLPTEEELAS